MVNKKRGRRPRQQEVLPTGLILELRKDLEHAANQLREIDDKNAAALEEFDTEYQRMREALVEKAATESRNLETKVRDLTILVEGLSKWLEERREQPSGKVHVASHSLGEHAEAVLSVLTDARNAGCVDSVTAVAKGIANKNRGRRMSRGEKPFSASGEAIMESLDQILIGLRQQLKGEKDLVSGGRLQALINCYGANRGLAGVIAWIAAIRDGKDPKGPVVNQNHLATPGDD